MSIILMVIIAATVLFSYKGFNDVAFFRKFEFHIGSIQSGEQIRMITSGFLHADLGHLFFNMFTLYMFAPVVTGYFGSFSLLLIYSGSLILGNLLSLMMHKNDYGYRAIGASGAVMGVLYSAILIHPNMEFYGFVPAYIFGVAYLLYSIYGMKTKNDNIGHTAHFGGAIGGYLITLLKDPAMLVGNTATVVFLLIPIVLFFVLAKMGKL